MRENWALMVLLVAILAGGVQAEEKKEEEVRGAPMLATLNIIQVSNSQLQKLEGVKKTGSEIEGKVLQSLEIVTVKDQACLVHLGEKWPLVYYDPRAEQFQIQYVDVGGKLDVTCRESGQGSWNVEIRPEASAVYEIKVFGDPQRMETYPNTTVLIAETNIENLKFGETSLFAKITGRAAKAYLDSMGLPSANPNLLYTLKLEAQ